MNIEPNKSSGISVAVFIVLLFSLFIAIAVPIVWFFLQVGVLALDEASSVLSDQTIDISSYEYESVIAEEYEQTDDSVIMDESPVGEKLEAKIIQAKAGESLPLNDGKTITVNKAYVIADANTINELPSNERLVGIQIHFLNPSNEINGESNYYVINTPYVSFDGSYRAIISDYSIKSNQLIHPDRPFISEWELGSNKDLEGEFAVLVPQNVKKIKFYIPNFKEGTSEIKNIFEIPLKIKTGGN